MCSTPPASATSLSPSRTLWAALTTACRPEAHALWMVNAGTGSASPARRTTWRARLGPFPAWRACPMITSSTLEGWRPARSRAARATQPPSSAADEDASAPPKLPIGVRTPPARTTRGSLMPSRRAVVRGRCVTRSSAARRAHDRAFGGSGAARSLDRLPLADPGHRLLLGLERASLGLAQPPDRRLGARALRVVLALGLLSSPGRTGAARRGHALDRLRRATPAARRPVRAVLGLDHQATGRRHALLDRLADGGAPRRPVVFERLRQPLLERLRWLVGRRHVAEGDGIPV